MGALDSARGALGGHNFLIGAISGGAIPRPGGGAAPLGLFRFDLLADLSAFGVHNSGDAGRWARDTGGSTLSNNTGPGTNSGGGYVFVEATSSSAATIRAQSRVDMSVVDMWPAPTGRVLRLRICAQGAFSDAGEGFEVQSRVDNADVFDVQKRISGWAYSNTRSAGDTIQDYGGVDHACTQDGGWIDVDIEIPDGDNQVRFEEVWSIGSAWVHDIALWQAQLRNA